MIGGYKQTSLTTYIKNCYKTFLLKLLNFYGLKKVKPQTFTKWLDKNLDTVEIWRDGSGTFIVFKNWQTLEKCLHRAHNTTRKDNQLDNGFDVYD